MSCEILYRIRGSHRGIVCPRATILGRATEMRAKWARGHGWHVGPVWHSHSPVGVSPVQPTRHRSPQFGGTMCSRAPPALAGSAAPALAVVLLRREHDVSTCTCHVHVHVAGKNSASPSGHLDKASSLPATPANVATAHARARQLPRRARLKTARLRPARGKLVYRARWRRWQE
jgi:hypothetical protein